MKYAQELNLDEQRREFAQRRFLAMPLAGAIIWLSIGAAGLFLPERQMAWILFIGAGGIFYLGAALSRFTGENFFDKNKPKNSFDKLFFLTVGMSLLVYAIAIPFFIAVPSSLPLTVGILTGLMWLPFSWLINHNIGIVHALSRTILIAAAWYLFPEARFVTIPFIIVFIYGVTIVVLEQRWRRQP